MTGPSVMRSRSITGSIPDQLARIDGWPITAATLRDAVEQTIALAMARQPSAVYTLNLDHLVKLRASAPFRAAYGAGQVITADGAPVVWLARLAGARGIERTTGADLVAPLSVAAADAGLPMYLYGTTSTVLAKAGRRLAEWTDGRLDIAGSAAPSAGFDPEGAEAIAALKVIEASGARICLVALGAPKQELFAALAASRGVPVTFVCVGAALDFLAGQQVRAPQFMQRHGLEWLWRLAGDPRRLAARYARCAALLAELAVMQPLRQRRSGA
jgi:exopolysaccharide biosynthesis WecB/TagA/CpsF family protein